jgi:hypothetical protein
MFQTNDETPYTLYANNTPLYVFNHHFDDVLALPNNDDATIELKAVFDDGFVCSTNVNFKKTSNITTYSMINGLFRFTK